MTPEMLELARHNQAEAGVENAEFLFGTIEGIPPPGVDVIISNCVINLAADKTRSSPKAHRVLRPDGLFAVTAHNFASVEDTLRGGIPVRDA